MPEVIDLLSSSPEISAKPSPPQPTSRKTSLTVPALANTISSDDFDFPLPIVDKPSKRPRLSPAPVERGNQHTRTKDPLLTYFSDDDSFFLPSNDREQNATTQKTHTWMEVSDPITFTSSAPEPAASLVTKRRSTKKTSTILLEDDIDDFDAPLLSDPFDKFLNSDKPDTGLSDRTMQLLARINEREADAAKSQKKPTRRTTPDTTLPGGKPRPGRPRTSAKSDEDSLDEPTKKPKRPGKLSEAEKEARAREREAAKARREEEREVERERKRKLKEEKAKEKQVAADIAEVNKVKLDKKTSTPEMIVDMSTSFEGTSVGTQVGEYMKHLGVEKTFFGSRIPNIVKWRRKVTANLNEEAGRWEPCPLEIRPEGHVLCLLPAQEFVDMVTGDGASDESTALENHVLKIQGSYPGCKRIYLIEGLTAWMRKNKNSRNRSYQAAVKRQMEQDNAAENPSSSQPTGRKRTTKKPDALPPIDDDIVEDALLQLQVTHACLIHHTAAPAESAEWIKNFTEHVSTVPYRKEQMNFNDAAFCMEVGQVKSGEDNADTFVKMLQEVHRLTAPVAYGIAAHYPTVTALLNGMKSKGPLMLEDVKVSFRPQ
ncbi:hypothetical protein FQN54_006744 [Arachnomyces sp. PD_36]|nr:hypothetical protein FQN54_006744 [Arachnomyces sp. PD_36]